MPPSFSFCCLEFLWGDWLTSDLCLLQGNWCCKKLYCEVGVLSLVALPGDHKIMVSLFHGVFFAICLFQLVCMIYSLLYIYARAIIHFLSAWKFLPTLLWLLPSAGLQFQIQELWAIIIKIASCSSAVSRHGTLGLDARCSADGGNQLNKRCQGSPTCCYVSHKHTWGQGGMSGVSPTGCMSTHGEGLRVIICNTW